jgi:hypothetical protein
MLKYALLNIAFNPLAGRWAGDAFEDQHVAAAS